MPDFSHRFSGVEMMDDLQASGGKLHQALRELDAINYVLGGNYATLNGLVQLLDRVPTEKALHIADLGCGSGDMLVLIRRLLVKRGRDARLTGIDANPNVIEYAQMRTPASCRVRYDVVNILSPGFRSVKCDIIIGTLFFHHFTTTELITFFRQLKDQLSTGFIINDIHRHWLAYYSIKWITRFFSRTPMVKHDAPISVLRAFTKRELVQILDQAGLTNYTIKWCWAFRWQVVVTLAPG